MTPRQRFNKVMNFQMPDDRIPMIEWAPWWNKTLNRWWGEGLDLDLSKEEVAESFGLDPFICIFGKAKAPKGPKPVAHGVGIINNYESYKRIHPYLYTDEIIDSVLKKAQLFKERHLQGEIIIRLWLDGFFWFPRTLLGIEGHFYSFYDQPDLLHRINTDLANFNIRLLESLFSVLTPDMVGYAEDMSYNKGPMLSEKLFEEFITPYYKKVNPIIKGVGCKILVDSDGDITSMVPWLHKAGVEGAYPLERQAGVDISKIRKEYPQFLMIGGYDKMVMSKGEEAMRREFERLLPVMRTGGYIPSVDHQTPPGVSLKNYKIYLKLFKEYAIKAVLKGEQHE